MIDPLTLDELRADYGSTPRRIDTRLLPLTRVATGPKRPFPTVKLLLMTAAVYGAAVGVCLALDEKPELGLMLAAPVWMGIAIGMIRAASPSARTAKLLETATLVEGRVIKAHGRLYQPGDEPETAAVAFSTDAEHRFDRLYLRDVVKKVRSAAEAKTPPAELAEVAARVEADGPPVKVPAAVAGDDSTWVARVVVEPKRLPEAKLVDHAVPLLVQPADGLAAHVG